MSPYLDKKKVLRPSPKSECSNPIPLGIIRYHFRFQLCLPDNWRARRSTSIRDVSFWIENNHRFRNRRRCKYPGSLRSRKPRQGRCAVFGKLQLNTGWLDRMGLPVDEHEESPVERHDTGRVGLLDVASLWTQPRRAQLGSRANVQIVFRAIHQPHKLGKSRHLIVSCLWLFNLWLLASGFVYRLLRETYRHEHCSYPIRQPTSW